MEWRSQARRTAEQVGISPHEVDRLLEWHLGWSRLAQRIGQPPSLRGDRERLQVLWKTRIQDRVPLQYLLGHAVWRGLELQVTPAVLIPRPETELLVDIALDWMGSQPSGGVWLDLGTGSGALAIALAQENPRLNRIYAIDLSAEALAVAATNAERYGVQNRICFLQGSWFEPVAHLRGKVQGMVSNPPYIPSVQIPSLQPEVGHHEPSLALDGGESGLESLTHLIQQAPLYLQAGGFWGVEIMEGQAQAVMQQLREWGPYTEICSHLDLAGIDRFITAQVR